MSRTSMNYLALNQNILGKLPIIGKGFSEGTEVDPYNSISGLKVFINGKNKIDEIDQLNELFDVGEIYHPALMTGMPDVGGEIKYFAG